MVSTNVCFVAPSGKCEDDGRGKYGMDGVLDGIVVLLF